MVKEAEKLGEFRYTQFEPVSMVTAVDFHCENYLRRKRATPMKLGANGV